jgi:RND family efflux transporter MFP subunit
MIVTHYHWRAVLLLLLLATAAVAEAADYTGTLQWARRVTLSTPNSGVISEVNVNVGDRVKQGQVLLRLDDRACQARIDQIKADIIRLTAANKEANAEWQRGKELYERTVLSDHELELLRIAAVTAHAELQSAQAGLVRAEQRMLYCRIRAPFDGIVVERRAEAGQTVVSQLQAQPLLGLAATDRYQVTIKLTLEQLADMKPGQPAGISAAEGSFDGEIKYIGMEPVDQGAVGQPRYALVVEFATPDDVLLRTGQTVRVRLE